MCFTKLTFLKNWISTNARNDVYLNHKTYNLHMLLLNDLYMFLYVFVYKTLYNICKF